MHHFDKRHGLTHIFTGSYRLAAKRDLFSMSSGQVFGTKSQTQEGLEDRLLVLMCSGNQESLSANPCSAIQKTSR